MKNLTDLTLIVKVTYPENSLTLDEQKSFHSATQQFVYFYGPEDIKQHLDFKLNKLWRPGAIAEFYDVEVERIDKTKKAGKQRGVWDAVTVGD